MHAFIESGGSALFSQKLLDDNPSQLHPVHLFLPNFFTTFTLNPPPPNFCRSLPSALFPSGFAIEICY
jgi:hypothetical protein